MSTPYFDEPRRFNRAKPRARCGIEVVPGVPCGAELAEPWQRRVGACEQCLEGSSAFTARGRVQLRGAAERYVDEAFNSWQECRRDHVACAARAGGVCSDEPIDASAPAPDVDAAEEIAA